MKHFYLILAILTVFHLQSCNQQTITEEIGLEHELSHASLKSWHPINNIVWGTISPEISWYVFECFEQLVDGKSGIYNILYENAKSNNLHMLGILYMENYAPHYNPKERSIYLNNPGDVYNDLPEELLHFFQDCAHGEWISYGSISYLGSLDFEYEVKVARDYIEWSDYNKGAFWGVPQDESADNYALWIIDLASDPACWSFETYFFYLERWSIYAPYGGDVIGCNPALLEDFFVHLF